MLVYSHVLHILRTFRFMHLASVFMRMLSYLQKQKERQDIDMNKRGHAEILQKVS